MTIQGTILGLLMSGPKTGYLLKQMFDSSLGFFAGASFGSIYPTLRKCEQAGLVKMELEIQNGRPNRKVYSLTPKGRKIFLAALREDLVISPYRNEFLTKLFFFSHLEPEEREAFVRDYIRYVSGKMDRLAALDTLAGVPPDAYQTMCYAFGLRYVKELARNAKQLQKEIEKHNGARRESKRIVDPRKHPRGE